MILHHVEFRMNFKNVFWPDIFAKYTLVRRLWSTTTPPPEWLCKNNGTFRAAMKLMQGEWGPNGCS